MSLQHPWQQYLTRLRKKLRQRLFVIAKRVTILAFFGLPILSEKAIENDDKSYDKSKTFKNNDSWRHNQAFLILKSISVCKLYFFVR